MFCLLDLTCGGPRKPFQRNGGVCSVTTMCCLLFVPNKKRYLLIFNLFFDLVILTLLLLSFRLAKGKRGNQGYAHQNYSRRQPQRSG
jgi:hypothetical protein